MTTFQAVSNILATKYSGEGVKGIINKGVEIGQNIGELMGFGAKVLESKTNKDVDPFAEQREELMEIINNEELSLSEKAKEIAQNFKDDIPCKLPKTSAVEFGAKIGEWSKSLFSKPQE